MGGFSVVEEATAAVGKRAYGDTWGDPLFHSQHRRSKRYIFIPNLNIFTCVIVLIIICCLKILNIVYILWLSWASLWMDSI